MTPDLFLHDFLNPGLAYMTATLGAVPSVDQSTQVLLLATAGQESSWKDRRQVGGPAHSFWQFERFGGVARVVAHARAGPMVQRIGRALEIPVDADTLFTAMIWNDQLATAMARLNYWIDPAALPKPGDEQGAWDVYDRVWAPGKPDRARWHIRYQEAWTAIQHATGKP